VTVANQGFWAGFCGSLAGGLATAAVVATIGIALSERVAEASAYLNPTCDNPRGLRPIPTTDVEARGPAIRIDANDNGKPDYPADRVLDGYEGSAWMPPIAPEEKRAIEFRPVFIEGENILKLKLSGSKRDIKLVCVNNALGASRFAYENWGKSRTVVFWVGQESDQGKVTVLQALPPDEFQRTQEVADMVGVATELNIQLIDAYSGIATTSVDPDHCSDVLTRQERGEYDARGDAQEALLDPCIVAATPYAGLSEVVIYEIDKNDRPPIPLPGR